MVQTVRGESEEVAGSARGPIEEYARDWNERKVGAPRVGIGEGTGTEGVTGSAFTILGHTIREARRELETFPTPPGVGKVTLWSDEVSSLCPITGQPDWDIITVEYHPALWLSEGKWTVSGTGADAYRVPGPERTRGGRCIESKSFKLYLWSFREEGHFCEQLSGRILGDVVQATDAAWVQVTVEQKARGGVVLTSVAECHGGIDGLKELGF